MPGPDTTLPNQGLEVARLLYEQSGSVRPKQAYLRSVQTTAYYAVFHFLVQTCADTLVGKSHRNRDAWNEICRSVTHSSAKKACEALAKQKSMEAIKGFTEEFPQLQDARVDSHYDTLERLTKFDAAGSLRQAQRAIATLRGASPEHKIDLAVRILASGAAVNEARNKADKRRADAKKKASRTSRMRSAKRTKVGQPQRTRKRN